MKYYLLIVAFIFKAHAIDFSFEEIERAAPENIFENTPAAGLADYLVPAGEQGGAVEWDINFEYAGEDLGLTNWERLDPEDWMDLALWKRHREMANKHPYWRVIAREQNLVESMGRVLACEGNCHLYRGKGRSGLRHRSLIREGDQIETREDSYAWIFLVDGTLVRLAPETSLSLIEIKMGKERISYVARLNHGQMSWIARTREGHQETKLRETDSFFYPLNLRQANWEIVGNPPFEGKNDRDYFSEFLSWPTPTEVQVERLNLLWKANNHLLPANKSSHLFLILPNTNLEIKSPLLEAISLPFGESFVRLRKEEEHSLNSVEKEERKQEGVITLRRQGHETTLKRGHWYEISSDGNRLDEKGETWNKFLATQTLIRRIPTIMLAREIWLEQNLNVLNALTPDTMAAQGYRLWENWRFFSLEGEEKTDLDLRLMFLRESTQYFERRNIADKRSFAYRMEGFWDSETAEKEMKNLRTAYDDRYYRKAFDHYVRGSREAELYLFEKNKKSSFGPQYGARRNLDHLARERDFWSQVKALRDGEVQ